MKLVSVPTDTLVCLIWNAELLAIGMNNDTIDKQIEILKGYLTEDDLYPLAKKKQKNEAQIINIFTGKRIGKS